MSARRMISDVVVGSDRFTDMPLSAQALYFHLVLQADNRGFFASPNSTVRRIGASKEDMECLIDNGFVIRFQTGVCCITHWNMMNTLKNDRNNPSSFAESKMVRLDGGEYILDERN